MFRKHVALLMTLMICCTSLGACSKEAPITLEEFMKTMEEHNGPSIPLERKYEGVSFSVVDATSKGASFQYENRYDMIVGFGYRWHLFVSTESDYRYVDIKMKNLKYKDILSGEPLLQHLDFKRLYKGLKPGSYRIVFPVEFPHDNGKHNSYNTVCLYADFEISK